MVQYSCLSANNYFYILTSWKKRRGAPSFFPIRKSSKDTFKKDTSVSILVMRN